MTVLTSGTANNQGKTVQLESGTAAQQYVSSAGHQFIASGQQVVMSGGQRMQVMQGQPTASLTSSDGPVTSDATLAQLAAEAGQLEGEGEGVSMLLDCEVGGQVDRGMVTPQEGEVGGLRTDGFGTVLEHVQLTGRRGPGRCRGTGGEGAATTAD